MAMIYKTHSPESDYHLELEGAMLTGFGSAAPFVYVSIYADKNKGLDFRGPMYRMSTLDAKKLHTALGQWLQEQGVTSDATD